MIGDLLERMAFRICRAASRDLTVKKNSRWSIFVFVAGALMAIVESVMSPIATPLTLRIVGVLMILAGAVIVYWTRTQSKFITGKVAVFPGHKVCTTGPFQYCRHPVYAAAMFLLYPGIALAAGSFIFLVAALMIAVLLLQRTACEEDMLQRDLAGYRAYVHRVPNRFIPLAAK